MTTQSTRCPRCGEAFPAELESNEYEGICPRCLAFLAADAGDDVAVSEAAAEPLRAAAKDPPPLKRGATFHGMEVLELVGQGGMGVVYKARQIELDRVVALKILSPRLASDDEFPRRFNREAKALASLDHPNIVRVHDVGREGDLAFLVMEYVDGVNLRDLLVQKKLAPEQALRIVPQLCDALEYAHSRGVIHRDIKPENIILSRSGAAKIADFGLAKIVNDEKASATLTQTNVIMGTADYMAPEQRDRLREADHRADIYSLGVVFYELLTGELPVGRFDPPSRRLRLDVRIDEIVLKALEKDPERRYQHASQMGREVDQVAVSGPPRSDCPVVDLASGQRLGTAPGRRLAIRCVACRLVISGWERDEIGLRVEGDYQFDAQAATPMLQSQVETSSIAVTVPRGVELDVVAAEGSVTVESVVGQAAARVSEGSLEVLRHEGPLRVHSAQGQVAIRGLKTEYFEVRARAGEVRIQELELARGRGQVETECGSVTIEPTPSSSFRYYLETRSGHVAGPASGQVGAGAASLTVRSGSGSIELRPPPLASLAAAGLRDVFRQLTPRQVEKLGTYVIVNLGLFILFILLGWSLSIPIIVAVFWGMMLALEFWKGYVRRTGMDGRSLSEKIPAGVRRLMKLVPTPTPAPPPSPPPPRARASALAILALAAGLLSAAAAAGGVIAVAFGTGSAGVSLNEVSAVELRRLAFGMGVAAFSLAALGLVLGMAAGSHVRESRGILKGKAAASVAGFLGVVALGVVLGHVRPYLREVEAAGLEARATAQKFVDALGAKRYAEARALLSEELKAQIAQEGLQAWASKREGMPGGWKLQCDHARVSASRTDGQVRCSAETAPSQRTTVGWLGLQRKGSWRVCHLKDLFKERGE